MTVCAPSRVLITTIDQDDWYEGYFIPKGTTVIGNIWYVFTLTTILQQKIKLIRRYSQGNEQVKPSNLSRIFTASILSLIYF